MLQRTVEPWGGDFQSITTGEGIRSFIELLAHPSRHIGEFIERDLTFAVDHYFENGRTPLAPLFQVE